MFIKLFLESLLKDLPAKFKGVTDAYAEYYKAVTYEKLVIILSGITLLTVGFIAINLFMLFMAIGAALFVGRLLHNFALGFVILGVLYALGGWIIYKMRRRWVINPVVRMLQEVIYSKEGMMEGLASIKDQAESMVTNEEVMPDADTGDTDDGNDNKDNNDEQEPPV